MHKKELLKKQKKTLLSFVPIIFKEVEDVVVSLTTACTFFLLLKKTVVLEGYTIGCGVGGVYFFFFQYFPAVEMKGLCTFPISQCMYRKRHQSATFVNTNYSESIPFK